VLDRPQGMWREVAFAAVLAVLLPVSLLLEYWQAALLTGFVAAGLFGLRGWFRFNPRAVSYGRSRMLRYRVSHAGLSAVAAQVLTMFPALGYGVPVVVLAIALGAVAGPAARLTRLRGTPVPGGPPGGPPGGAAGRFVFEGTVHALAGPQRVPGGGEVALWVVRQGRRQWSSAGRVEVRAEDGRRAWIEPGCVRPVPMAWNAPSIEPDVARALGRRDDAPFRIWEFAEGDPVFVIGPIQWAPDPPEPWYRGPGRSPLFAGDLRFGWGRVTVLRRAARHRLRLWLALAAWAGLFALAAVSSLDIS